MSSRPEVFVSAAIPELIPYREAAVETLREMGVEPVLHTDLSTSYGPLDGRLKVSIGRCVAVIHLVGFSFGQEPPDRTHEAPRLSFSHFEMQVARDLNKEVFYFVAKPGAPMAPVDKEDTDARLLQSEHRRAIERREEFWSFSSPEELATQLKSLRLRLIVKRRFARLPFGPKGDALVGRERMMSELGEAVESSRTVVLHPPAKFAALSASAGKTVLAVEAAWRWYESRRFDFVFLLPGASRGELESALAGLARIDGLALVQEEISGHHTRLAAVRRWLLDEEREDRVLVILDGVDNEVTWWALTSILPWFARARLIITSRLPLSWPDAAMINVGSISTEAAVEMLRERSGANRTPNAREQDALERLARLLAGQPLALDLAGRLLAERSLPAERLVEYLAQDAGGAAAITGNQVVRWQPVFARLVREATSRLDSTAQTFLHLLVCMAPQPAVIPLAIFSGRPDLTQTRTALAELQHRGLAVPAEEGQSILVHRLVREIVRDRMTPEQVALGLDGARALIEASLPKSERTSGGAAMRERLVAHCRVLLGQLNGHPLETRAGHLARGLASWLRDCGRLGEAEHFQRRAVRIAERERGVNDSDVAAELRGLAGILRDQHRHREAEELHRRAIANLEKKMPSAASELVGELYSLASCLRAAGQLEKAESVLRRVLAIEEKQSGRMHLRTGIAVHALAMLLEVMKRPVEAVELYRRALEIDEHTAVPSAARISVRLHNLSSALFACGNRTEAIERLRRAVEMDEATFGSSHPELVVPLTQLAVMTEEDSGAAAAEPIWRKALACAEVSLDPEHIERAVCLIGLASVCRELGRDPEATKLLDRAARVLPAGNGGWHPLLRTLAELTQGLKL